MTSTTYVRGAETLSAWTSIKIIKIAVFSLRQKLDMGPAGVKSANKLSGPLGVCEIVIALGTPERPAWLRAICQIPQHVK